MSPTVAKVAPWGAAVLAFLLFGLAARASGMHAAEAKQSASNLATSQHLADSLTVALVATQDSMTLTRARVDTVRRVVVRTVAVADTAHHQADSLIASAPIDTGHVCTAVRAAYDARTSECDQLRQANTAQTTIIGLQGAQLTRDSALFRLADRNVDSLKARLHLVTVGDSCHLLPFVPCPSRKVAFWAGLALGGAIGYKVTR